MALPYPTKVVLPFDIATAQDMNERHANDVALAAGTGLNDGAITLPKINGGTTAGVLTTNASGNVAIGSKTTDANGWTVYNYGAWKEYIYNGTATVPGINAHDGQQVAVVSLPVGFTNRSTLSTSFNYNIGPQEYYVHIVSMDSASNITIRAFNAYTANIGASVPCEFSIRLKTR